MNRQSIRTKLTFWNVGVFALALIAMGVAISIGARTSLINAVDKDMLSRANRQVLRVQQYLKDNPTGDQGIKVLGVVKGKPVLLFPGNKDTIAMVQKGEGIFESVPMPQPPPGNDPGRSPFRARILRLDDGKTSAGEPPYDVAAYEKSKSGSTEFTEIQLEADKEKEPVRLLTVPVKVDDKVVRVIQYPQPLSGTYQALSGITWTLVTVLPLILLVAGVGGAFLAGRALKPVRELTETAGRVSVESLDGRLEVKGNDEFSRLSQTFNGMMERLQSAFGGMEQAIEQQRRFTADASHELRTPLTVIKANTSLALKGERSAEDYKKTLTAVNAAADTMNRLVTDLLLLARSDGEALELSLVPVCLRKVLRDAISCVERPGVAPVKLEMECEDLELNGDAHSLVRVFINLLENSARHTPESGTIKLEARSDQQDAIVTVQDSGRGISSEHLPHIFDRFYRVDQARARAEGGNGLGLAICKSIIDLHHGTISIASTENVGTTVTVKIPLHG